MIRIENHLEVYVDPEGHVCLGQPSMNEDCGVVLEPEEVKTLIDWLNHALKEARMIRGNKVPVPERGPVST